MIRFRLPISRHGNVIRDSAGSHVAPEPILLIVTVTYPEGPAGEFGLSVVGSFRNKSGILRIRFLSLGSAQLTLSKLTTMVRVAVGVRPQHDEYASYSQTLHNSPPKSFLAQRELADAIFSET
jgi:hypothetical protein